MEDMLKKQITKGLSEDYASLQSVAAEHSIKTMVTTARILLMHAVIRCTEGTLSTNIWSMKMDYAVWVHNVFPDMQSGLSAIEICSRSRFDPVS